MSETKNHYETGKLARAKAMDGWGRDAKSSDSLLKSMTPAEVSEGALLELVRRLNQAIRVWSEDDDINDNRYDPTKRPDNAVKFPEAKVGDRLYTCDEMDDTPSQVVVVEKDEAGFIRYVYLSAEADTKTLYLHWATTCDGLCVTQDAAVKAKALSEIEYHEPKLQLAKNILALIEAGQPYEHLMVATEDE